MGDDDTAPDEDITLHQVLFDLNVNLCENFPGLTPFVVRRENFHEVVTMFVRLIDRRQRVAKNNPDSGAANKPKRNEPTHKYSGGYLHGNTVSRTADGMIRRPAKDDSWF